MEVGEMMERLQEAIDEFRKRVDDYWEEAEVFDNEKTYWNKLTWILDAAQKYLDEQQNKA